MKVSNSTFEKIVRYIRDMETDSPTLLPQYYTMVEKTPTATMRSPHFTCDGQVFTRSKAKGGNLPSSWCISGKSLSKKELADRKHQEGFKAFMGGFFNMVQSDSVVAPIIISADDIKSISLRIQNDFK